MSINQNLKELLEKDLGPLTFAMFLRGARASKDMTQTEMASRLKISKSTLCDIEKGRQLVSPALAAKIANKCGLSVKVWVEAALRDQLRKAKLNLDVRVA
jgi:DNA-binding XRE family transcriptional regulator